MTVAEAATPDIVGLELEQQGAGALHPLFSALQGFCSAPGLALPG